jgi:hypothetical protein
VRAPPAPRPPNQGGSPACCASACAVTLTLRWTCRSTPPPEDSFGGYEARASPSKYPDPQSGGYIYGSSAGSMGGGSMSGGMCGGMSGGMGESMGGSMGGGSMGGSMGGGSMGGGMGESADEDAGWGQHEEGGAPSRKLPPVEQVKEEMMLYVKRAQVLVQVDQNAQIAAVGAVLLGIFLLLLMGIWLVVLVLLGLFGGVGFRVAQLQKGGTSKKTDVDF